MKSSKQDAFTLIELLVVISIIAILAGIALPVFGEVQVRGAQTKALSNAKQIGLACKLFATDYNGNYPMYTDISKDPKVSATPGSSSNDVLQTLMPDYLPDKSIFGIPKSAFCKKVGAGQTGNKLGSQENEWAYCLGLSDTSNSRFPLLADGFKTPSSGSYSTDETDFGGVWKGKKAIVIRCDTSGTVETLLSTNHTVKRSENNTKNAFIAGPNDDPPWFGTGVSVLNPAQ
ncbi:MAG: hypothetical protein JWL90_3412 [Chthoniobacteraceae bacterium]|nr:hypothetical protein [Chthoniobacteraceae bacterium]MDB6173714.1 hypothetical protein [Chthoniobacteraceae bacterium]